MTQIVPLNNVDHADLRVARGYGAAYGDAINLTRVFPTEFEALQREYVILFRPSPEGGFQAVAVGAVAQGGMGGVHHLASVR